MARLRSQQIEAMQESNRQDEIARKAREDLMKAAIEEKDKLIAYKEGQKIHLLDLPAEVSHLHDVQAAPTDMEFVILT